MIGKSFLMVILLLFSIPIASFADDNKINGTCPGEVIEEINGATTDASHIEKGAIGWGGNDRYRMTFNVDGNLTIHAYNRSTKANANYYFYVSRDSCGNDDADWNIVSKEYGTDHQTVVQVHNGDTIYVRLQSIKSEPNKGQQWYALSLDFKSACHGCDCSLDNNRLNSSSPGVSIVGLDGATDDINKCFSGITDQAEGDPDKKDYYNFTAGVDGSATITTSSPNGHKYHMTVWVNGDPVYGDDDNTNVDYTHSVGTLYLNKGDKVIMKFKESGDDLDEYQVNVSFSKFICGGCDCSLDKEPDNDTSAGVVIPDLDGATTDVNKCISGHSADDDEDYYNFTVQSDGELKITTSSPNNHDFYLIVKKNGTEVYPKTASQNHNVSTIDLKSGDNVILYFKETGNDLDEYQANLEFKSKFTPPTSGGNIDNLCYENVSLQDVACSVGVCKKESVVIKNIGVATLSNLRVDFDISSTIVDDSDCGIDGTKGNCSVERGSSLYGSSKNLLKFDVGTMSFNDTHTLYEISEENSDVISDRIYASFEINGVQKSKQLNRCPRSYCKEHKLSEGFHIVDIDGGDESNSFEIYCDMSSPYAPRDLLALPIKTSQNYNNNFLYDTDRLSTVNYYEEAKDHSKSFQAVEFDAYSKKIVARSEEPLDSGNGYKTMGGMFSNINLIGTPFGIDWSNTNISHCDTTKLRKAYHGQAVKVNLLDYTNARCEVEQIQLKLLDDYKYLTYLGVETLEHSCKEMSENVPANILKSEDIKGHYWIYPRKDANDTTTKRDNAPNDITKANERPIVVYCWYQTDLDWAWTFLLSLDGVVTNSKNDIIAKRDTCSQLGLWFFVPNSKDTFDRVRKYLLDQKTGDLGWENYTGTVREKYKTYKKNPAQEYYITDLGYELIWPYGPLGIYYPCYGNRNATDGCKRKGWAGSSYHLPGWMSGAPMHNIKTLTNYANSMGAKGWVSILGSQDLNITDDWWVSDIGAGEEYGPANSTTYSYNPHGTHIKTDGNGPYKHPYYEPNGNYARNAWLNFLHDDEGWIYHNDDNNAFYAYYDYMCMSETNYITATRYLLVPGFFNTLERGTRSGNSVPNFGDDRLTTQIVGKPIELDLILYKFDIQGANILIDKNQLTDMNKSVGVFLATKDENDNNKLKLLKFLGGYKNFTDTGGRIQLPTFTVEKSYRTLFLHYYYCNDEDMNWTQCWDYEDDNGLITVTHIANTEANASDSYDSFSARPKMFEIDKSSIPSSIIAGEEFNLTLKALDENNATTMGYNRPVYIEFGSPSLGIEKKDSCLKGKLEFTKTSATAFTNGIANISLKYSEVGDINITLTESPGTEYAKIDANDTDFNSTIKDSPLQLTPQDIYREIEPARADNLRFTPSYFEINGTFKDFHTATSVSDTNFTYISDDLNMSSKVDFSIIAKSLDGQVTKNYNKECAAKDINIDIGYYINSKVATDSNDSNPNPGNLDKILFELKDDKGIVLSEGSKLLTDKLTLPVVNASVFSTDHNGSAILSLRLNFDRKMNKPVQPFLFKIYDLNVSDGAVENNETNLSNSIATYLYARAKSSQLLYDDVTTNSIKTPNSIVVYTLPAGTVSLDSSIFTPTNEYDWFFSTTHREADGNVTLVPRDSTKATVSTPNFTDGKDDDVLVSAKVSNRPLEVDINLTGTNRWLIFNPNDNSEPDPFYKVRFIGGGSTWTGFGKTGSVVDTKSSKQKTKRLEW